MLKEEGIYALEALARPSKESVSEIRQAVKIAHGLTRRKNKEAIKGALLGILHFNKDIADARASLAELKGTGADYKGNDKRVEEAYHEFHKYKEISGQLDDKADAVYKAPARKAMKMFDHFKMKSG